RLPCPEGAPRLDRWLAEQPSVGSRRRAREALESGKVSVDGRAVGPEEGGLPVPAGAVVEIDWNRPGTSRAATSATRRLQGAGLRIVFEDPLVVVIDKPPGLLTDTVGSGQAGRHSVLKRLRDW